MRRFAGAAAILALLPAATPPPSPIVATDHGRVRGVTLGGRAAAFRGIPFAAPPVGPLRWREARPAAAWQGVRPATRFGAICPQVVTKASADLPQSEDCLTLNVVTPDLKGRLPVLFEVHGGAFYVGSGRYIADKDLSPMVRRGVVLVSPNYRVGRFGFFAHPALTAENGGGTGNFWLSDQLAALRWVHANIARFGGDPGRVTLLGCSAGGSSVNALMISPPARGLFAGAGVHSGGGLFNAARPIDVAERQGLAFAARAGVSGTDADALARLRRLSPAQVLAADPGPPDFGAIVDGRLLPRPIALAFARGEQARVPFIAGSTSNEASVFGLMGFDAGVLRSRFGIDLAAVRPAYEGAGPLTDAELLRRAQTDFLFTAASLGLAGLAARAAPAWSYHFDYVPVARRASDPGAPHCGDMPYLFGIEEQPTAADARLAEQLGRYWYNFIARGDPNGTGLPAWGQDRPGTLTSLVIGDTIATRSDFRRAQMEPWFAKWRAQTGATARP